MAGVHGAERRNVSGMYLFSIVILDVSLIKEELNQVTAPFNGCSIEIKGMVVTLLYL